MYRSKSQAVHVQGEREGVLVHEGGGGVLKASTTGG
jgi:hypothetical protein